MSEPRLVPEHLDLVWFRGPDSIRFLNDLVSQEIAHVQVGSVVRSMLLGPRGKLDHLLWVLRGDDEVGLLTDTGRGQKLAETLGRYRIRVDVDISDPVVGWLTLEQEADSAPTWNVTNDVVVAWLPWNGPSLLFSTGEQPLLNEMSPDEWTEVRIAHGEPRFGVDVDESTIPQETGLVEQMVDFTKGCYLGQELVARINSRGHVNRHLRKLQLNAKVPTGSSVVHAGQVVGTLTSAAGERGLGLIRREVQPGDVVEVGGSSATVS